MTNPDSLAEDNIALGKAVANTILLSIPEDGNNYHAWRLVASCLEESKLLPTDDTFENIEIAQNWANSKLKQIGLSWDVMDR